MTHNCVDCGKPALPSDERCGDCMAAHWLKILQLGGVIQTPVIVPPPVVVKK